ncbi:MAG TPA: acyl-CoA dehydrogenase family protein [Steroidobacteraceae bacterium]|nr:acyl-CoA dehydrogenase family protein [Steroidobacteraceae bacterium]
MNYGLTDDQASILAGLEQLIAANAAVTPVQPRHVHYSEALARAVAESGYLAIAREGGFGVLDAALVVERLARLPWVIEAAASAIVAPILPICADAGPIALSRGDGGCPARFLPMAKVLVLDQGDVAVLVRVEPGRVEWVESLLAYPYGRLDSLEGLDCQPLEDRAALRRRTRIALAVEAAGCMAAAVALVVEHVKARHAFGRPLGSFQAIQHRLAMAAEVTEATKWLAFRAAWSDTEADAAIAAAFAQSHVGSLTYDLHQFCGAMGLTLEFPLHLWTYRLRALLGELGGASAQARAAAVATWG